jgi:hypothetical protein
MCPSERSSDRVAVPAGGMTAAVGDCAGLSPWGEGGSGDLCSRTGLGGPPSVAPSGAALAAQHPGAAGRGLTPGWRAEAVTKTRTAARCVALPVEPFEPRLAGGEVKAWNPTPARLLRRGRAGGDRTLGGASETASETPGMP